MNNIQLDALAVELIGSAKLTISGFEKNLVSAQEIDFNALVIEIRNTHRSLLGRILSILETQIEQTESKNQKRRILLNDTGKKGKIQFFDISVQFFRIVGGAILLSFIINIICLVIHFSLTASRTVGDVEKYIIISVVFVLPMLLMCCYEYKKYQSRKAAKAITCATANRELDEEVDKVNRLKEAVAELQRLGDFRN